MKDSYLTLLDLKSYYAFCRTSLMGVAFACGGIAGVLWPPGVGPLPVFITMALLICLIGVSYVVARRLGELADHRLLRNSKAARTERLAAWLLPAAGKLQEYTGRKDAELAVVSGARDAAWTARTKPRVVVMMTPGFIVNCASERDLSIVLAHEAGHVLAGDVEKFRNLARLSMIALTIVLLMVVIGLPIEILRATAKPEAAQSLVLLLGIVLTSAVSAAAGWSSLLCVRELEADAYCLQKIGDRNAVSEYLSSRGSKGRTGKGVGATIARLWCSVVQPSSAWRATLPAMRGDAGKRLDYSVGLSLTGAFLVYFFCLTLIEVTIHDAATLPWLFVSLTFATAMWVSVEAVRYLWARFSLHSARTLLNRANVLARFTLPSEATVVMIYLLLGALSRKGLGAQEVFLAGGILSCIPLFLWAWASMCRFSSKRQSISLASIMIGLLACILAVVLGVIVAWVATGESGSAPDSVARDFVIGAAGGLSTLVLVRHAFSRRERPHAGD